MFIPASTIFFERFSGRAGVIKRRFGGSPIGASPILADRRILWMATKTVKRLRRGGFSAICALLGTPFALHAFCHYRLKIAAFVYAVVFILFFFPFVLLYYYCYYFLRSLFLMYPACLRLCLLACVQALSWDPPVAAKEACFCLALLQSNVGDLCSSPAHLPPAACSDFNRTWVYYSILC
eukprot:Rmarinus@m.19361